MSSWNNRFKKFSSAKELKIENLIEVNGRNVWDDFNEEVEEKFEGRIYHVYSDCICGVIDLYGKHISEEQFNEDCKEINKMLNKLLKTSLQTPVFMV